MNNKPAQVITCKRCDTRFERARRGAMPRYCPDCRLIVHRVQKTEAMAAVRADLRDRRDQMRAILEPMRDYMTDEMIMTADQFIDELAYGSDVVPLVQDKMPAGTMTPSGPDEGATTEFSDLAGELEQQRLAAIMHEWHAEHPAWWQD